jgi:hypothetical protein
MPILPFKLNHDRRHRTPKQKYQVTNTAAYDAALCQRGSLTVWFTDEAIAAWQAAPRTTPGGQPRYSPVAILTALTSREVFRLALRQTEGLIGFILQLLGLALAVPDHTTLSRRAETLKVMRPRGNGTRARRSWRKLHIGLDAENGQIVAATLTRKDGADGAKVGRLLGLSNGSTSCVANSHRAGNSRSRSWREWSIRPSSR